MFVDIITAADLGWLAKHSARHRQRSTKLSTTFANV